MDELTFDSPYHAPVLVAEVLAALAGATRVLDGTLGGGGHSEALLEAGAHVTALDRDPDAIAVAGTRLATWTARARFRPLRGNFGDVGSIVALDGATFDGILLDLGVSSHQVDDARRGFSFREGAPLDMRMDGDAASGPGPAGLSAGGTAADFLNAGGTAADFLNATHELELTRVFREYGDEPKGGRLAREIVRRRVTVPFATSDHLVGAIRAVLGARSGPSEFARLFQAIRIAVNGELDVLARALPALRDHLQPGGVMAVIAYHSGEDRIVKHAFREWSQACICPPRQPMCTCRGKPLGSTLHKRALVAGEAELARNARARSARLRAWRTAAGVPASPAVASAAGAPR